MSEDSWQAWVLEDDCSYSGPWQYAGKKGIWHKFHDRRAVSRSGRVWFSEKEVILQTVAEIQRRHMILQLKYKRIVQQMTDDLEKRFKEITMSEWKKYRKKVLQEMRPYIPGEDLTGISVSTEDVPGPGGMIARAPGYHKDQWYVNKEFAEANYELAEGEE